jgi:FkbM family methyltransferase
VDIGSNIGWYATNAAAAGHNVIAIKPFGLNVPLLMHSICHNMGFSERVQVYKVALSDKAGGDMCMWSTNKQINNGNARLTPYFEGKKNFDNDLDVECMERITSFTLDELLLNNLHGPKLNVQSAALKIDIEGFETRAFMGAESFFAQYPPCHVMFEHQLDPTHTTGVPDYEIFRMLERYGYELNHFGNDGKISRIHAPALGGKAKFPNIGDFWAVLQGSHFCDIYK